MSRICEARGPRGWQRRTDWSLVGRRVALLLLAVGTVRAADTSPAAPAASAPAADVSIDAAKRDFEAIKAARNPAEQPRAELPRVTLPDIGAAPTPLQPSRQSSEATDPKAKKSKGWLVDAMEAARKEAAHKAGSDRKDGTTRDGFADRTSDDSGLPTERNSDRENETKSEAAAAAEKPKPAVKDNPLTQYMAAWMTPQDYSLLRPVVDAAAPGGDSGSRTSNSAGPSGGASPDLGATADIMAQIATAAKPAAPSAPTENPFLATINLPAPTSMPVPAAAAPSPSVFSAPPPPPVTPPPSLPDLVKKSSDDKYYKPLKRF